MERLELSVLGVPHLRHQGRLLSLGNRKTMALVVYLAVEGGMHARDKLAGLLWPEAEAENARMAVRKALVRLRDLLPAGGLDHLEPSRNSVGIKGQGWQVDGLELRDASIAIHQQRFTLEQLRSGLTAYRGDFLECFELADAPEFNGWADGWRATTRGWMRQALETTCRVALEAKRLDVLESSAERWVQFDSLDEAAYRQLIVAHLRQGSRSAAQATLEQLRRALLELGSEPDVETLELFRAAPTTRQPAPFGVSLAPSALVGRDRAREALLLAVEDQISIIVRGEPGVGKTSLIQETFPNIHPSSYLLGRPGDAARPFATLVRHLSLNVNPHALEQALLGLEDANANALRGLLEDKLEVRLGDLAKPLLTSALRQVLSVINGASQAPIVLDDLQFMDASSRGLLLEIYPLGRSGAAATPLILAYRTGELEANLERQFQEAIGQHQVRLLELQPLAVSDLQLWLTRLEAPLSDDSQTLAVQLHRSTAGNPLFMLEALRNLSQQTTGDLSNTSPLLAPDQQHRPERLARLIQGRLERLSQEAQDLAHLMAVASTDFNLELAARVLGCTPLSLSKVMLELERAQLVGNTAFTHDLVYESVLSEMSNAVNTWLHHQIALNLSEGLEAAEHHWSSRNLWNTPERSRACRCLVIAGKTLAVRGDLEGCLTWFDRARSIGATETERVTASLERIKALVRLGRFNDAEMEMNNVESELEWVSDPVVLADGLTTRASMLLRERFEPVQAKALLERALRTLEGLESDAATAILVDALDFLGRQAYLIRDLDQAEHFFRGSAAQSELLNDRNKLARAWTGLADTHVLQGNKIAEMLFKRAMELRRESGDTVGQVVTANNLALWYLRNTQYQQALDLLTPLIQDGVDHAPYELAMLYNTYGMTFFYLEEYLVAQKQYQKTFDLIRDHDMKHALGISASFNLAEVQYRLGQTDQASITLRHTEAILIEQHAQHSHHGATALALRAELAISKDQLPEALRFLQMAKTLFENLDCPLETRMIQARMAFVSGDSELAREVHQHPDTRNDLALEVQSLLALGSSSHNLELLKQGLELAASRFERLQVLEVMARIDPNGDHITQANHLRLQLRTDSRPMQ